MAHVTKGEQRKSMREHDIVSFAALVEKLPTLDQTA